jgi:hypothetical protein
MEGSADYLEQLEAALEKRSKWLSETQIQQLKDAITSYQSLFDGAMALLIRKGLLREDPYNYEQVFTEIVIPKDDPLPDFENTDEVSYRLAAFRRQLKFLTEEAGFDLHALTLVRLKKISALVTFINWLEFGEGSTSPTTRAFARVFMKVRMGTDSMASQILKDCDIQAVKTIHQIRGMVAELIAYHRESWKTELRRKVLRQVSLGAPDARMRKEEALRAVRRGFGQWMQGKPWYPALAEEVVEEELSSDGPGMKEKVLASLAVVEAEQVKTTALPEGKPVLLEAVRILSRPHEELATALAILEENERLLLLENRGSGGGWLRRLLGRRASPHAVERVYKVEYAEPGVPAPKTEVIDFPKLLEEAKRKSSLMATLSSGMGPALRRLESTNEGQLAAFVDKQLNELLLIHRRLGSLNTYFHDRAVQEKKTSRGIKIELLAIKNSIVKGNQRRHEYKENGGG